ncbi:carbohydrate binding domain-containing protein [Thalassotalea sp. LPB0316]|uniref:carbohydrate binding domain-containing protein n=1 Tax=Thalassotalea sp. LPB0316 TaxID=2769490 RepID=UPI0018661D7D|nr:carbohydrate binding domain-containing protein [Thalassotalea sp. LPB0316]QOL25210.1 carbohydrate binding domain-containing protein [Thalassotalea sp. LPB0316]
MSKERANTLWRLSAIMLATAVVSGCGGGGDAATTTTIVEIDTKTPTSDWELVWSDEFDSGTLNLDNWNFEINCDGGGNAEEQCYTDSPDNLFIQDGILNIVARPTPDGANLTKPYTSSRITTQNKVDFTYGRIEVKAKAPRGQGSWAAAWLMPTNSEYGTWPLSGEIDLVEWVNIGEVRQDGDIDRHAHGTLHYGPMQGSNHDYTGGEYPLPNASPADDFHVYAIEWEEGEIRWYIDDVLYAYQTDSQVTYRASDGAAAGLSETGWYTQIINDDDETEIVYEKAPFNQDFFIILNNAVGGNWAGRTHQAANYFIGDDNGSIAQGVDHSAYVDGNAYQVDYVRVYQCTKDPITGKGCATISSDYYNDTYIKGAAPVPIPPIIPVPVGVDIFTKDQSAWDIVGQDEAQTVDSGDETYGEVVQFTVTNESGELGFSGPAYDGSLLPDEALIEFDINVLAMPADTSADWVFKVEYEMIPQDEAAGSSAKSGKQKSSDTSDVEVGQIELALVDSLEGVLPTVGQWQHYSFELGSLRALGLNSENILSIKIFPTVGKGAGAVYQLDNVTIGAAFEGAELLLFEDQENPNWPMWDDQVAKGVSSIVPVVVADEDPEFGNAAEFYINGNSVVGFTVRQDQGGSGYPFDASSLALTGAIEFDLKLIDFPENPNAPWYLKLESNGGTNLGGTAVDYRLPQAPVQNEWTHYTVSMNSLLQEGLDISAIDIALIFPQWGQGDGARFRVDNMIIHSTAFEEEDGGAEKGPDNTVYQELFTLYDDAVRSGWTLWDCCAGLAQVEVMDDQEHDMVVEFTIGEGFDGGTVVGFWGRSSGEVLNLAPITNNGVLRFDLKVETMPMDENTNWLLKVESSNATGNSFAELNLTDSLQGTTPTLGEWQTYSFPLVELAGAGLNLTEVDLLMIFPEWGKGLGAVYRVDNVFIGIPEGDENPYTGDGSGDDGGAGDDDGSGSDGGSGDDGSGGDDASQEVGVELIQNADFANNAGWGGTDGMVESIANGVFTADVAIAGNPWDVSLKQNLLLQADATYTLSFDARSDDARSIIAGLGLDEAPWTNVSETVALTTQWTNYSFTLTTTGFGSANSRVFFDMGAEAGHVQLDNVSVVLVSTGGDAGNGNGDDSGSDGELLTNSAFDSAAGWGGTDGMVESIADGVFTADVAVAGNAWDVSLKQNLTLVADTDYVLTFDARSDDSRSIIVGLGLDQDPWTNVTETVALSTEWVTYTLNFTTTGFGGENNRVFFDMGAQAGHVQLDNVSLVLASDSVGDNAGGDAGEEQSSELLANSAFDSAAGWGGTDGMVESIANGVFTADVAVAGNAWDVSLKQNLTLVADTDYVLTFDARSDDARSIIVGLGLDQDPWTNVTETVALSTEWVTYTLNFTTTGFGGENNRVFFDMGAQAGHVQLDNVSLVLASDDAGDSAGGDAGEEQSPELLANSAFDSAAGWGGTDGMVESIADGVFTADVAVAGNAWDVSLKQNLTLVADTDYVLTFDARSDDARSIIVGLGLDQDPWTNVTETVALSTEWVTYTLNFTTTGFGGENNRVFFDMGAQAGHVQLDNVSLVLASDYVGGDAGEEQSPELLANSAFDSAAGWGGTDGMVESIADGVFTADVAVAGNAWDVSLKQNLTLVADTDYVLTFDARSDDARSIIVGLGLDQDPWTNVTETVALSTEWVTYTLNFTTTGFGGENNRVFFDMGAQAGHVQLDNVSLVLASDYVGGDAGEEQSPELLANSAFDSAAGWGGTDGMVESIADGVFTADVAVAGNAWDVSLKQNLTLVADTDYVLTFDARSDDARSIIVGLGLDQDPWTNVTETVALSTEWVTYTLNFTTTGFGGENNRVFFDMGAQAGHVQLDNVSLTVAAEGGDEQPSGPVVTLAPATLFADSVLANWASWDCCAGSTPSVVNDGANYGEVIEFTVNGDTVLGLNGRDNGGALDASAATTFSFEMKVTQLPSQTDAPWLLKMESGNAGSFVEVNLSTSQEGVVPSEGTWQTYTFNVADLVAAGVNFDQTNIDIVMVFPAWGQGAGAVYRIDNVRFE